jgi:prepilin-type processing-associated H-X9-DG protein
LVPVLDRAKSASKISVCQSNLRQLACGFQTYLSDWNDAYPCTGDPYLWMGRRWRWPIKKYIALGVFHDPNNTEDPNKSVGPRRTILLCPADYEASEKWDGTSYAYSVAFYHTPDQINSMTTDQLWKTEAPSPPCVEQKVSNVLWPTKKALLGEWMSNHSEERTNWWDNLRRGARNYAFADGHVAYIPASRIGPTVSGLPDINLTRDGIRGKDI